MFTSSASRLQSLKTPNGTMSMFYSNLIDQETICMNLWFKAMLLQIMIDLDSIHP